MSEGEANDIMAIVVSLWPWWAKAPKERKQVVRDGFLPIKDVGVSQAKAALCELCRRENKTPQPMLLISTVKACRPHVQSDDHPTAPVDLGPMTWREFERAKVYVAGRCTERAMTNCVIETPYHRKPVTRLQRDIMREIVKSNAQIHRQPETDEERMARDIWGIVLNEKRGAYREYEGSRA